MIAEPGGASAAIIEDLWSFMLWLGVAAFLVVTAIIVIGLFKGDAGDPDTVPPDVHADERTWLVGWGSAFPILLIGAVLVATITAMVDLPDTAENAVVVEVRGHQWWWELSYPDSGVVTANELHIPAGRDIELLLTSADVIHSFWVPTLAGKIDALPDGVNRLVLSADEPGIHLGRCAEFCGLGHAKMGLRVVVTGEAEFEAWLERQGASASPPGDAEARAGMEAFLAAGCGECHTIRGTDASGDTAPDLTHVASREMLAAETLPNTPEHLAGWIATTEESKPGVDMGGSTLTSAEIEMIVAYLGSLD